MSTATLALQFRISPEEAETLRYLGDGVYASFDGYQVWLRTLEGNCVAVEPSVMKELIDYAILHQGEIES